jgi:hypothetical protein
MKSLIKIILAATIITLAAFRFIIPQKVNIIFMGDSMPMGQTMPGYSHLFMRLLI